MIRMYCDGCNQEIKRNYVDNRLRHRLGDILVEVMVAVGSRVRQGHVCRECVLKAVMEGVELTDGHI